MVAHPGHELRVHGWLEQAQPSVHVITDGSGGAASSRIASTARVLERAGATPGVLFGRHTDRELYDALLARDHAPFVRLGCDLVAALRAAGVECVVADAREGYNSMHDVCRLMVDRAVEALRRQGREVLSLSFPLVGAPAPNPGTPAEAVFHLALAPAGLARKLAAAESYPELRDEVDAAFDRHGAAAFGDEYFTVAPPDTPLLQGKPYYETFGEARVAEGRYAAVIRYREHVLPLAETLSRELW